MKKIMVLIGVFFTASFMLMACSNDAEGGQNSNDQEDVEVNTGDKENNSDTRNNNDSHENNIDNDSDSNDDDSSDSSSSSEEEVEVTDEEIEEVVEETYKEIIDMTIENESSISEIVNESSEDIDTADFMENGVDPDHPFFEEMHDLLYPQMEELVAQQGMEDIIDNAFLLYMNPRNITPFSPTYDELDVLEKDNDYFEIKQSASPGVESNDNDDSEPVIFMVEFEKEDGQWKFLGEEREF